MPTCAELVLPAVIAASLTNDLYSYEKEAEAARRAGNDHITNALWVLMVEHDISLEEARERAKGRIKEEVAKYVQVVADVNSRHDLSSDARKYIELMQYSVSGNVVWSIQCPRYHKGATYNERQRLRAEFGVDKYPTTHTMIVEPKEPAPLVVHEVDLNEGTNSSSSSSSTVVDDGNGACIASDVPQFTKPLSKLSDKVNLNEKLGDRHPLTQEDYPRTIRIHPVTAFQRRPRHGHRCTELLAMCAAR
jgi:hypothetical protein